MKNLKKIIQEKLMISLFEYILESLINANELNKDLKFVESSKKEVYGILDTNDYKHGEVLGMSKDDLSGTSDNKLFLEDETIFYKIQYQENIIGIFGVVFPKQFKNLYNINENYYYTCRKIFSLLGLNSISGLNKNADLIKMQYRHDYNKLDIFVKDDNMKDEFESWMIQILEYIINKED